MSSNDSSTTRTPPSESQLHQASALSPHQQTFTHFTRLPPELRNKIWHLSPPAPTSSTSPPPLHPRINSGVRLSFSKTACFPIFKSTHMLSIRHESRAIALPLHTFVTYLHPRYLVPFSRDEDIVVMDL
ncbi:uncharacterized protein K444DRAFT_608102 [Hyaloscypha bicolor E]|uniref:2EXR domain-containing protein n=1 Tax=Hyaloscypha bicolor E TaxID=1095630 RepID=A0A2J6TR67_9HELO|nr:uncharacterized protein K444DRAFT_608102 [Hyaloscypha bicolor E]PMD65516.1 hypothetical protein K444DRAFT_608102 [Hyaloscypha bicolor E]